MSRHHDILGVASADTIIGAGVKVKGTLKSDGDITIDGLLDGEVIAAGNVSLGVNAVVAANITARDVAVAGHLQGDIIAQNSVSLNEVARMRGNISSSSLNIAAGAVFSGTSRMEHTESTASPTKAAKRRG